MNYKWLCIVILFVVIFTSACSDSAESSTYWGEPSFQNKDVSTHQELSNSVLYLSGKETTVDIDEKWIYRTIRFIFNMEKGEEIILSIQNDSEYTLKCPTHLLLYTIKNGEWIELFPEFFGTEDMTCIIMPRVLREYVARTVVLKLAGVNELESGQYRLDLVHVKLEDSTRNILFDDSISFFFSIRD